MLTTPVDFDRIGSESGRVKDFFKLDDGVSWCPNSEKSGATETLGKQDSGTMISRKTIRAKLNLPTRRVASGELEIFESHNFKAGYKNWGDHISAEIVSFFFDTSFKVCTDPSVAGKTLVVGSVMANAYPGDSVWGARLHCPWKSWTLSRST